MIDLSKLSVSFSVKIDSPDRLRNLTLVLRYFRTFFSGLEILIIEQADGAPQCLPLAGDGIRHFHIDTADCHYKTRNLNLAASLSSRPYIMMCDVDAFVPPQALQEAIERLEAGADFVSPYNGIFAEVDPRMMSDDLDLERLLEKLPHFGKTYALRPERYDFTIARPLHGNVNADATGGIMIYRREPFFLIGGWNENFVSYGFQDMEFHARIERLGYKIERLSKYNCYHLPHARSTDSRYNNFQALNESEYEKICSMPERKLWDYSQRRFRAIDLDTQFDYRLVNSGDQYALTRLDQTKRDLSDRSIVFAVNLNENGTVIGFLNVLEYLEQNFNDYDIVVVEIGTRSFKYLPNRKNVSYHWLAHGSSLDDAVACGLAAAMRESKDVHVLDQAIDAGAILSQYAQLLEAAEVISA